MAICLRGEGRAFQKMRTNRGSGAHTGLPDPPNSACGPGGHRECVLGPFTLALTSPQPSNAVLSKTPTMDTASLNAFNVGANAINVRLHMQKPKKNELKHKTPPNNSENT